MHYHDAHTEYLSKYARLNFNYLSRIRLLCHMKFHIHTYYYLEKCLLQGSAYFTYQVEPTFMTYTTSKVYIHAAC